jgi:hypothetical protein
MMLELSLRFFCGFIVIVISIIIIIDYQYNMLRALTIVPNSRSR